MTDLFIRMYSAIGSRKRTGIIFRYNSLLRFMVRTMGNVILPFYFRVYKYKSKSLSDAQSINSGPRIIVSLTSFPLRINKLWIVVETLIRQSKQPDKIILWLSKSQFSDLSLLPNRLMKYQSSGLEIRLVDANFRSHKKYFYFLSEFPNDYLITVDDDIFYSKHLIERLWSKHLDFPKSVICNYGLEIARDENQEILPYQCWRILSDCYNDSCDVFFGSGGGVLFPPCSLHPDTLKPELFMDLCPLADDIWLNAMVRLQRNYVIKADLYSKIFPIQYRRDITLASTNLGNGLNDEQIAKVRIYYLDKMGKDPFGSRA